MNLSKIKYTFIEWSWNDKNQYQIENEQVAGEHQ